MQSKARYGTKRHIRGADHMSLNGKTAVVTGAGSGAEEANYVTGQTIGVNGGRYLVS